MDPNRLETPDPVSNGADVTSAWIREGLVLPHHPAQEQGRISATRTMHPTHPMDRLATPGSRRSRTARRDIHRSPIAHKPEVEAHERQVPAAVECLWRRCNTSRSANVWRHAVMERILSSLKTEPRRCTSTSREALGSISAATSSVASSPRGYTQRRSTAARSPTSSRCWRRRPYCGPQSISAEASYWEPQNVQKRLPPRARLLCARLS